jgi:hypothetical protein
MTNPYMGYVLEYGPPALLAGLTVWLLWPAEGDRSKLPEWMTRWQRPAQVPLLEAARRAYSETEESDWAKVRRSLPQATADELLVWYASGISKYSTIQGCKPPSITEKPQDCSGYIFVVCDNEIVAKNGPHEIRGLKVSETDLRAFIARFQAYPGGAI